MPFEQRLHLRQVHRLGVRLGERHVDVVVNDRHQADLGREVENAIGKRPNDELLDELAEIERRVENINVPLSYTDELYSLRTHIHMVAERLIDPVPVPASAQ